MEMAKILSLTQQNIISQHQGGYIHLFICVLWDQPYVWHFKRPDIDGIINYCFKFLEIVTHCYLVTIYHRWTVCCTTSLFSSYSGIFGYSRQLFSVKIILCLFVIHRVGVINLAGKSYLLHFLLHYICVTS